jgi:hypothetical protein
MVESKPIRRVVWGCRFLAATVVVPPSMAERLNTDALASETGEGSSLSLKSYSAEPTEVHVERE